MLEQLNGPEVIADFCGDTLIVTMATYWNAFSDRIPTDRFFLSLAAGIGFALFSALLLRPFLINPLKDKLRRRRAERRAARIVN